MCLKNVVFMFAVAACLLAKAGSAISTKIIEHRLTTEKSTICELSQFYHDTNFCGDDSEVLVGCCSPSGSETENAAVLRVDDVFGNEDLLKSYWASHITFATIRLHVLWSSDGRNGSYWFGYNVSSSWNKENITWDTVTYETGENGDGVTELDLPAEEGIVNKDLTITQLAKRWTEDSSSNNGVFLTSYRIHHEYWDGATYTGGAQFYDNTAEESLTPSLFLVLDCTMDMDNRSLSDPFFRGEDGQIIVLLYRPIPPGEILNVSVSSSAVDVVDIRIPGGNVFLSFYSGEDLKMLPIHAVSEGFSTLTLQVQDVGSYAAYLFSDPQPFPVEVTQCNGYYGSRCQFPCMCTEHGVCDDGADGNGLCISCEDNYYSTYCQTQCPCDSQGTLSCDDGISGDGTCNCLTGRFGFDCSGICNCGNGECDDGSDGTGTCTCREFFYSANCSESCIGLFWDASIPGYNSSLVCSGFGNCLDGTNGNGSCVCHSDHWGEDCSQYNVISHNVTQNVSALPSIMTERNVRTMSFPSKDIVLVYLFIHVLFIGWLSLSAVCRLSRRKGRVHPEEGMKKERNEDNSGKVRPLIMAIFRNQYRWVGTLSISKILVMHLHATGAITLCVLVLSWSCEHGTFFFNNSSNILFLLLLGECVIVPISTTYSFALHGITRMLRRGRNDVLLAFLDPKGSNLCQGELEFIMFFAGINVDPPSRCPSLRFPKAVACREAWIFRGLLPLFSLSILIFSSMSANLPLWIMILFALPSFLTLLYYILCLAKQSIQFAEGAPSQMRAVTIISVLSCTGVVHSILVALLSLSGFSNLLSDSLFPPNGISLLLYGALGSVFADVIIFNPFQCFWNMLASLIRTHWGILDRDYVVGTVSKWVAAIRARWRTPMFANWWKSVVCTEKHPSDGHEAMNSVELQVDEGMNSSGSDTLSKQERSESNDEEKLGVSHAGSLEDVEDINNNIQVKNEGVSLQDQVAAYLQKFETQRPTSLSMSSENLGAGSPRNLPVDGMPDVKEHISDSASAGGIVEEVPEPTYVRVIGEVEGLESDGSSEEQGRELEDVYGDEDSDFGVESTDHMDACEYDEVTGIEKRRIRRLIQSVLSKGSLKKSKKKSAKKRKKGKSRKL